VTRRRGRPVALVTALVLVTGLHHSAFAQDDPAESGSEPVAVPKLQRLRDAILEVRELVSGHEREERQLFDRLEQIDRSIEQMRRDVTRAEASAEQARWLLVEAEVRQEKGERELGRTRAAMSKRVVALYKTGQVGPLQVLFSSGSLQELMARVTMLRKLLQYDVELVERHARDQAEFDAAKRAAAERALEFEAAAVRLDQRTRALGEERATKTELMARVRADRKSERAVLVELEQAARALEETLGAYSESPEGRSSALADANFEQRKGRLSSPVKAPVSKRFGKVVDAEYLTETYRKGIEFGAPAGATVRAVAFGEVRYAGWFRGYGKIIIVDHGSQFFTVSGDLADMSVEVGKVVDEGDTIGSVGDTGSLTGPGLYFEIRRGSEPLDPAKWLGR
jgi:septal ring factor EnvC (AmiA/AmiB activator)